jgi:hypothetical protein
VVLAVAESAEAAMAALVLVERSLAVSEEQRRVIRVQRTEDCWDAVAGEFCLDRGLTRVDRPLLFASADGRYVNARLVDARFGERMDYPAVADVDSVGESTPD